MKRALCFSLILSLTSLSGFSQKNSQAENSFLLVVDVQEYYTNSKLSEGAARKLIDSINYVISHTKPTNVIYIKSTHKLLNVSLAWPFVYASVDSSALGLDKRMNLVSEHIFIKEKSSAFSIPELTVFLKQNNVREIVIVGLLAEQCVYETLIEGKELGYDMYVIPEAVVGKSDKSKAKVINELMKRGINVFGIHKLN
jgi:nicotinamidase-related amidase